MPSESGNPRLDSWKEIAAYLRRHERTVQRWRRDRGLPVHQLPRGRRGGVYAFPEELDAWLRAGGAEQLANGTANGPAELPATPQAPAAGHQVQGPGRQAAIAVTVAVVLVAAVITTLRLLSKTPEVPARFSFSGSSLVAYAADGRVLWTHTEPGTLVSLNEEQRPERDQVVVRDLDGDGAQEILVALSRTGAGAGRLFSSEFLRFSTSGKVLERFSPQDTLQFGSRRFGPPWDLRVMLVTEEEGRSYVWLAFSHNTWWPSLLLKRDAQGREVGRFVSAGWILSLAAVNDDAGSRILAGGISNQWASAFLAVLPAGNPSGQSPAPPDSPYLCAGCPRAEPLHYFLLPPSEIAPATDQPYNKVRSIIPSAEGIVYVYTAESTAEGGAGLATAVFEFDLGFRLRGARRSDYYWAVHDRLYRGGRLDHSSERCPEREVAPPVQEWRGGEWVALRPARDASS